jgi:molecular chaperone GrpE
MSRRSGREQEAAREHDEPELEAREAEGPGEPAVADLVLERDEYLARWQRAQADYQNLRRRMQQDLEAGARRAKQPLLLDLLLTLDQIDMALSIPAESDDARGLREGIELIRAQILRTLESEGVTPVPEGGTFDPALHQAMLAVPNDEAQPGTVVRTLRRGWRWGEEVLRHAQVHVAAAPEDGPPGEPEA